DQARADVDMIAKLEEIRLRFSEGSRRQETVARSPEQMYADAFRDYGIPVMTLDSAEAAKRLRESTIYEVLLAFMHDWLYRLQEQDRARLREVLDRADTDNWRKDFRDTLMQKDAKKLSLLARAPGASAQPAGVVSSLAAAMVGNSYK